MINTTIVFDDFNWKQKDIEIQLPQIPKIGEEIIFPYGSLKFPNDVVIDRQGWKVSDVTWKFKEDLTFEKVVVFIN